MTAGAATLVLATLACVSPAAAGGFLQDLFGGLQRMFESPPRGPDPLESMAKAPNPPPAQRWAEGGPARGFCVRSCDGFYFPVRANPGVSAAEMCHAFCPASEARVYGGSDIDYAVARDGSRYADMERAYFYRKQTVAGCTCNGRNQFGLAHIDINSDPTLRPGDVVATRNGMAVYTGRNGVADFTPAASYAGFSPAYRAQLSAMRIRTTPTPDTVTTSSLALRSNAEVSDIRQDSAPR
ncbi:MAG TPA: DUF2865 domain-containing protein [Pseudolabrys sp.]|nr:DUF2865 domain-containing protein [Pseudolabrys sp.]